MEPRQEAEDLRKEVPWSRGREAEDLREEVPWSRGREAEGKRKKDEGRE